MDFLVQLFSEIFLEGVVEGIEHIFKNKKGPKNFRMFISLILISFALIGIYVCTMIIIKRDIVLKIVAFLLNIFFIYLFVSFLRLFIGVVFE